MHNHSAAEQKYITLIQTSFKNTFLFCCCFLADRTATQYDRLVASTCRPSVRLSVAYGTVDPFLLWCDDPTSCS